MSKYFSQLLNYARLMRWDRPIGILLLLWPTLWALWIAAGGFPNWKILIVFILGTIVMRSAGCVINDILDRKFDAEVARTKNRVLVTGAVSVKEAWVILIILAIIALFLVCQLNRFTFYLAWIGLGLAAIYPCMKRITYLPQVILGAAFAWSVPMAFAAVLNHIPAITWLVFLITLIWTVMYDTEYAMTDRSDDLQIGVKSTAILFGAKDRIIIACLQASTVLLLVWLGFILHLSFWFYLSVFFASLLFFYQQYLIKDRQPAQCFKAFLNNHWVGLIVFLGFLLH